jgi:hypothetical protein
MSSEVRIRVREAAAEDESIVEEVFSGEEIGDEISLERVTGEADYGAPAETKPLRLGLGKRAGGGHRG